MTTLRDTHGDLSSLLPARHALQDGSLIGARLLVAGMITGMGNGVDDTRVYGEQATTGIESSSGADNGEYQGISRKTAYALRTDADSLRILTGRYLDRGVDFIKIAVTDHDSSFRGGAEPLVFSRRALEAMIQEAHRRGKLVDSHIQNPEGLRMAVLADVDVVQHPEDFRDFRDDRLAFDSMPDDLARLVAARHVICSIFPLRMNGLSDEHRKQLKANAQSLVRHGCRIAVATDWFDPETTLRSIEVLVDTLGLTPVQALTAATRTGALAAAGAHQEYGTLEAGKRADVLVLGADPLADIHNIEKLEIVLHDGHVIDPNGYVLDQAGGSAV